MKKINFSQIDKTFAKCADSKTLGAVWSENRIEFHVWSPLADSVMVNLYYDDRTDDLYRVVPMTCDNGFWDVVIPGYYSQLYYTYTLCINGEEIETIDPYAKAGSVNGRRGVIFDFEKTQIEWTPFKAVPKSEAVICEVHIRDFSADENGNFDVRGKFSAFTQTRVTNAHGDSIGLDYLAELGVTHVQLLPVADFASVDERAEKPSYNWGYDPMNYFFTEGSYSEYPHKPALRVREFKELVNALHSRGIAVVMDVVFNHVYNVKGSSLNKTCPDYYFRHERDGKLSNGSGCGNEVASERVMARKFIADCLCHWVSEYHVDGFRFDLMGLLDITTLNYCAKRLKAINPDILLYGEGWTGGNSPLAESRRGVIANMPKLPEFSMFSDQFRDCVKGSVFCDEDKGYINGGERRRLRYPFIKSVLVGGVYHPQIRRKREHCNTDNPLQWINYVECHDNLTFADKLAVSMPEASPSERLAVNKMGAALVFLGQGVPFFALGQEFMRSKGGNHNSYNAPDSMNSIKWDMLTENRELADYYKGLIAIRRKFSEFRLCSGEEIRRKVRFRNLSGGAFAVTIGNFLFLINPSKQAVTLNAEGEYSVYADAEKASPEPLYKRSGELTAPPKSVLLAMKNDNSPT